jgi:hypothetical protein
MKQKKTLPTKLIQKERSRFDTSFKNVRKSVIDLYGQATVLPDNLKPLL